jgi:hypothetical protein
MLGRPGSLCMRSRWSVLLAVVPILLLAGCAGTSGQAPAGIPTGSAPTGAHAGSASSHANPAREESGVTVKHDGSSYTATKTVTFSNDFGGAAQADLALSTQNGGLRAHDWSQGGYQALTTLQGRGPTEQAARDALGRLSVTHSDRLASGRLTLQTQGHFPTSFPAQVSGSIDIALSVPAQPAYRITADSTNGGIQVDGLGGPSLAEHTTNGGIEESGSFNTVSATSTDGGIELSGIANSATASTDNGGIVAELKATASGSYTFGTTNGGMEVTLGGKAGYDVSADTVNGGVSVHLGGGSNVGSQSPNHKHVQSAGYDSNAIKVVVKASTTNGGIDISG